MKIAVVGGGVMGFNHARVLKSLGHAVVLVEPNRSRWEANLQNIEYAVRDLSELRLNNDEVQAYVIAVPTTFHFDIAKEIMETDPKPLLIEKPICATVEQAENLKKLAGNLLVMPGHIENHNPIITHTKQVIKNANIKLINTYRLGFNNRVTDVGVVSDLAIHDVGVVCHLLDAQVVEVGSLNLINPSTGHENYGKLYYKLSNGAIGSSEVSWTHPEKVRRIELISEFEDESYLLSANYLTQTLNASILKQSDNAFSPRLPQTSTLEPQESLKIELQDFIKAIESKSLGLVTLDQGIQALKVIEASYEAFRTGRMVKL